MIIVNVFFVETNKEYDFKVDETTSIEQIIGEMVEMIAEEEHLKINRDRGMFMLCDVRSSRVFSPMTTLAMNGISAGTSLMLI